MVEIDEALVESLKAAAGQLGNVSREISHLTKPSEELLPQERTKFEDAYRQVSQAFERILNRWIQKSK